jgi:cytochrome c biogenesis protein CcmG/thiol:disulfide interchange protein DsbE
METTSSLPARRGRFGVIARTVAVVVVTAAAIGLAAFLVDRPAEGVTGLSLTGTVADAPPRPGDAPPDFSVTTTDGTVVRLSELKGHPVWLTFGASWCSQCRAEAPDIEAAYRRHRDRGLVVLAVFQESVDSAADYATRVGLTFSMGVDPDTRIASAYHVIGIPTHVFIGADGIVREFLIGGLKPDDIERHLDALLQVGG